MSVLIKGMEMPTSCDSPEEKAEALIKLALCGYLFPSETIELIRTKYKEFATETANREGKEAVTDRNAGKWIGGNGVDYVRCSCCHKNYDWVSQAQYYNFCPNCGADMRERKTK